MRLLLLGLFLSVVAGLELNPGNYAQHTEGKTVFLKFFAPWCGHCKAMKPDWDKLMTEFNNHASTLVADVDCTGEAKPLCDENGIKGFPTLKWGDPASLEDYQGGRDYKSLSKFASELKPVCSPSNLEPCDDEGRAKIEAIQTLSDSDLQTAIEGFEKDVTDAEEHFKEEVGKLQKSYEELQKSKEAIVKDVKDMGLGLHKAVHALRKKAQSSE